MDSGYSLSGCTEARAGVCTDEDLAVAVNAAVAFTEATERTRYVRKLREATKVKNEQNEALKGQIKVLHGLIEIERGRSVTRYFKPPK